MIEWSSVRRGSSHQLRVTLEGAFHATYERYRGAGQGYCIVPNRKSIQVTGCDDGTRIESDPESRGASVIAHFD